MDDAAQTARPRRGEQLATGDQCRYSEAIWQAAELIHRRRWTVDVLIALAEGGRRYTEITGAIGATDKVLAGALRHAVERGLIVREEVDGPVGQSGVWYELTDMGQSLLPVLRQLASWAQHWHISRDPAP